jgi:hypothetical protein
MPRLCIGARKQAYLALCRLFCRKSQYAFPVHLLTKFYDTLDYVCSFPLMLAVSLTIRA